MNASEAQTYVRDAPWPGHSASHEHAALLLADEVDRLNDQREVLRQHVRAIRSILTELEDEL